MKNKLLFLFHAIILITFVTAYNNKVEYKYIEKPIFTELIVKKEPVDFEQKANEMLEEQKLELKIKAFSLANKYIGKKGDCFDIAMKFIKELKGLDEVERYQISESEAMAGDLIYYSNNGYGSTHWSVYLDKDIALHGAGQFDYKTYLRVVHEPNMSKPIFYRVVKKGENK